MSDKKVKTRIQNKHEPQANWDKATSFVPLAGELIVYEPDGNYTHPRFKIGDGSTVIGSLPFLHTLKTAGDITVDSNSGTVSVNDDSHNHIISNVDGLQNKLNSIDSSVASLNTNKADKTQGIFYIEGGGTTDTTNKVATWTGSHASITSYYAGLMIAYKIGTAGSTTTTLNINNLGAVTVVKNATTAVSTSFPVDSVILLIYTVDGETAYWKSHDYDANTRNSVGDYRKNDTKLYFVGTTSSDSSSSSSYATSYTNSKVYVGTDNCLYSNGAKVATDAALVGHTHTVSHTPAGTVSAPTITVTPNTATVNSITAVGSLPSLTYEEVPADNITAWSAGSAPSLTYSAVEASKITAWAAGSGSASLTGSVNTGPNRIVTLTLSHTHTAPSLTYNKVDADNITAWSAGSVPSLTYSEVKPHKITGWSAGTLPTKGSNQTVVTSIKSATSSQPTFSGTAATLTTSTANS